MTKRCGAANAIITETAMFMQLRAAAAISQQREQRLFTNTTTFTNKCVDQCHINISRR